MSKIEMVLIVGLCLAPIVALLFMLPKKFKKEKKAAPPTTEYKPEQSVVEEKPEEPKEVQTSVFENKGVSTDEFRGYLSEKKQNISAPKRISPPDDIFTEEYVPSRFRKKIKDKENKTIIEQIDDLSPELKALLLAGVLDKKDY